jgi:hypothetical protein
MYLMVAMTLGVIFIAAVMLDRKTKMTHGTRLEQVSSHSPASARPSGIQEQLVNSWNTSSQSLVKYFPFQPVRIWLYVEPIEIFFTLILTAYYSAGIHEMEPEITVDVTDQQGILTPPRHLIPPMSWGPFLPIYISELLFLFVFRD